MKIRIAQLNPTVGDIDGNRDRILSALIEAEESGADLLILPELCVLGYPPMDLLERHYFREYVYECNKEIVAETGKTALLFGSITPHEDQAGRKMYNSAILANEGKIRAVVHKTLLPTYDVFDEYRYFEPNRHFSPVNFKGLNLGITICEDIWSHENEFQYHTYDIDPARNLKELGADILINISASPFTQKKPELRLQMLRNHVKRLGIPMLYANQVGANTEIIFDGDSMALNKNGDLAGRASLFKEDHIDVDFDTAGVALTPVSGTGHDLSGKEERVFHALKLGLHDYVTKSGLGQKVVLGLSGGIDSALTAAIAAEAVGPENVIGVTMPSHFSSGGSVSDSEKLARNLGIQFLQFPIKKIYDTYIETLDPVFRDTEFNVAEENIQSRARGVLLMALSNKFGYMLLNTGNKSELSVGYCTLYGDMAGGLSVISDLYKNEVYRVSRWLNEYYYKREVIPESILTKPPSAELRPDQKDSDSLPDYDILDAILRSYVEEQLSPAEITRQGHNPEIVQWVVRAVDRNEYKRRQAPPGLRISPKAYGGGRRIPIVQRWTPKQ
ncbi:MAG TPA: NAD+ synthase [Balneolales bacterium]|nr:NAD+ synthase [Balneolales bacterium]